MLYIVGVTTFLLVIFCIVNRLIIKQEENEMMIWLEEYEKEYKRELEEERAESDNKKN